MAFTKQQALERIEKRDYFNKRTATPETLEFRKKLQQYRDELKGTPIQTGDKTVYFGGAGEHKILLHRFNSGADTTQLGVSKEWVVYGNENPLIRKVLLSEIAKLEISEEETADEDPMEGLSYEEIKKQIIEEYEAKKASKTQQAAEGLPSEFVRSSDL